MTRDKAPDTTRSILASNLRRLIDRDAKPGERLSVRAWALGKDLDVRLIDRLLKKNNAATLDTLEDIARAVGLQPWHLLYEDLDPAAPPAAPVSEADKELITKLRKLLG